MKFKKLTATLLFAVMVVSLAAVGAFAAPPEMPGGAMPGGPGGGGSSAATIDAPNYEAKIIENVTSISDIKTVDSQNEALAQIPVGATINGVAVEGLLTMTKNGVEVPIAEGEYTEADKVVITVTDYLQAAGEDGKLVALGSWNALSALPYRTALSVKDGKMVADASASSAISGAITDTSAEGVKVSSQSSGFSAIVIEDSDYTISGAEITMDTKSDGTDVNDFAGYGAGVAVYGDSKVVIENSKIETTGVAKAATFADAGADLIVRGSTLISNGGEIYKAYKSTANQALMINPPWVLGIVGPARTTNVMGDKTTGTYVDTKFVADAWGAVSIDTGNYMHLTLINSDVTVKGSGYGAYAIGTGTIEDYYGTSFDVDTYAVILTGAEVNLMSVEKGQEIVVNKVVADEAKYDGYSSAATGELVTTETATATANTVVNSKNFGFMLHANGSDNWNILNVEAGTEINTGNAAFLVKKVNAEINVDNASINSANGVILQMIDNDDDMVGAYMDDVYGMPTFNYSFSEGDGWSSTWGVEAKSSGWQTSLNVAGTALKGDIYNGTGYTSNGGMELSVNLGKGTTLTGAISATEIQHGDSLDNLYKTFTYRTDEEGFNYDTAAAAAGKLGHVINRNYSNGTNIVNVTLTDDAAWNVTADGIVDDLTAPAAAIKADKAVTITVKGTLTLDGKKVVGTKTIGNVTYVAEVDYTEKYEDLVAGAWYTKGGDYDALKTTLDLGLMNGTGETVFGINGIMKREQLATILYRAAGSPAVEGELPFTDAASVSSWAVDAVKWAAGEGIVTGKPNGSFDPQGAVTRQDMAVMLCRYAKGQAAEGAELDFADVADVAAYAEHAMKWAVAEGLLKGSDGKLDPRNSITRLQGALLLGRYMGNEG